MLIWLKHPYSKFEEEKMWNKRIYDSILKLFNLFSFHSPYSLTKPIKQGYPFLLIF